MKVRDRAATPWLVRPTQIFEAAFERLIDEHERDGALELLDLFERLARRDPHEAGVQHPDSSTIWLFETPELAAALPRLMVVYTIDDEAGFVDLWNVHRR